MECQAFMQPRYCTPGKNISCQVILEGEEVIGLKCETKGYVNTYSFPVAYSEILRDEFDKIDNQEALLTASSSSGNFHRRVEGIE